MPDATVDKEGAVWAHVDRMCFAFPLPEESRGEGGGSKCKILQGSCCTGSFCLS